MSRKERRVTFGREKKNGKRNDPGKAQAYTAVEKVLLGFWFWSGSGQAHDIFQARMRRGGCRVNLWATEGSWRVWRRTVGGRIGWVK